MGSSRSVSGSVHNGSGWGRRIGIINALFSPRTGPPSALRASPAARRSWSAPRRRKRRLPQAKTGTHGWGGAPQTLSVDIVGGAGTDE